MSRYIDADTLLMELDMTEDLSAYDAIVFEEMVKEQPTADVVEVVRCKDCTRQMICYHSDDYFCADGERREDECNI